MKIYLNDKEISELKLKESFDALEHGASDGVEWDWWDELVLDDIDASGGLHFCISRQSAY